MSDRIKLDKLVREFMVEDLGLDVMDRRYPRLLQIAINGLRDINIDSPHFGVKEVVLTMNDNDTVDLPEDFLDYYAIGTCNDEGELQVIGLNENLCNSRDDSCGDRNTSSKTEIPFFKIMVEEGYIAIHGTAYDEIVLRYKSDISKINGEFSVYIYDTEALKNWMWWKYIRRQRSYGLQETRDAEARYNKSKKVAIRRHNRFTLSEFMDALRDGGGYSISPRI